VTRRFFAPGPLRAGATVTLDDVAARHVRVLRLAVGDAIVLFDGQGHAHTARLGSIRRQAVQARILDPVDTPDVESPLRITVAQGLARGPRIEQVVQHGCELGVAAFVPVRCGRSQPGHANVERWRTVAREAARQCGRAVIPDVAEPIDLAVLLADPPDGLRLMLHVADEGSRCLRDVLDNDVRDVLLLVGPEGGLAPAEADAAIAAGFLPVNLGPRTMRTETAALAAVAAMQFAVGDWG
jgi:16S rRNA (uracil1498-N3)-methyltransferase